MTCSFTSIASHLETETYIVVPLSLLNKSFTSIASHLETETISSRAISHASKSFTSIASHLETETSYAVYKPIHRNKASPV